MKSTTWRLVATATLCCIASYAGATITTISPGMNLTATIEAAADLDTIQLQPGVYMPTATAQCGLPGAFCISKNVKVIGLGTDPSQVILRGGANATGDFAVYVLRYPGHPITNPSGATIQNLTIDTAPGGIRIDDFQGGGRLTDITLKDVVISAFATGAQSGFGVLMKNTDRVVADNVTVESFNSGFYLGNTTGSLVMNSRVIATHSAAAPALGVLGGSDYRVVGNTFGSPKANPGVDSGYSLSAGGVVLYNTRGGRFENNLVQGFRTDGVDITAIDLTGQVPPPQDVQNPLDNYIGKNTVISTGYLGGSTFVFPGGTGIWSNCGDHNAWIYGNDASGSPEGGISVWASNRNMVLGNTTHGLGTVGVFVSGGAEALDGCTVNTSAYATKTLDSSCAATARSSTTPSR